MYSPLELSSANLHGNTRSIKSKLWSCWPNFGRGATGFTSKPSDRRRSSSSVINFLCHLPLLIIWTLIVIIILHKLTSSTPSDTLTVNQQDPRLKEFFTKPIPERLQELTRDGNDRPVFSRESKSTASRQKQLVYNDDGGSAFTEPLERHRDSRQQQDAISEIGQFDSATANAIPLRTSSKPLLTTKKSISGNFARQSKVFILIVQDESFSPRVSLKRDTTGSFGDPSGSHATVDASDHGRHFRIPNHIRLLIDILDSHRIGFEVETTQFGLPPLLLADGDGKQFSVIIIDNFFKYTRLNRWVRDQLDRHCRSNEVGVISYLKHTDELLDSDGSKFYFKPQSYGHILSQRSIHSSSTTAKAMTDEFPLVVKPIKQDCRNLSSADTCLVDYQVSETSPILRILKRKQDFILDGELDPSQSPWTTISSNHITYEPITWAKFRRQTPATRVTRQTSLPLHNVTQIRAEPGDSGTQSGDHRRHRHVEMSERRRRNVIPSRSKAATNHQDRVRVANLLDNKQTETDRQDSKQPNDFDYPPAPSFTTAALATEFSDGDNLAGGKEAVNADSERQILSVLDRGLYDGIKRVLFGFSNEHWLNRILLLDAIEHLSSGRIISPLERFIQIDIDDMFVGEKGIRLTKSDVENLAKTQREFSQMIDGFKFNLGFSGKYFKHGLEEENLGDEALVANAKEFTWFCHFWSHSKAHLFNDTEGVANELRKNLEFAREKQLPLIGQPSDWFSRSNHTELQPTYAVAPHHSGVYPIHDQLYEAWTNILNVKVTSTEEYPHLRPASGRRAFVHKTITVLPRQTCGLYTHTIYKRKYPGGFGKLLASIRGGELFQTVLHNPVNIYMTHMSNYAHDRLAPFAFADLFNFVRDNTNLQLRFWPSGHAHDPAESRASPLGPLNLAQYYFSLYPAEREPLWTNPCDDKRHLAIWAQFKQDQYCPVVPRLLIVGPQKTGTSALYSFLKINPIFKTSAVTSSGDYEEIQFFNDKHYHQGIDWYFEKLLSQTSPEDQTTMIDSDELAHGPGKRNSASATLENQQEHDYYFDKSATYFDDAKAARRAGSLAPAAKIVILLIDPIDRAYSWYQHMRAHGDPIANLLSFEQLIVDLDEQMATTTAGEPNGTAFILSGGSQVALNSSESRSALALRNRCLQPGYYARHLITWLDYYPPRQIIIIDGEWFKHNPAAVMNRLQLILHVPAPLRIDYSQKLVFVKQKGFYCERIESSESRRDINNLLRAGVRSHQSSHPAHKCLGAGKGRKYPPMSHRVRLHLEAHYRQSNRQLARLLSDIGQSLPRWLRAFDDGESQLV